VLSGTKNFDHHKDHDRDGCPDKAADSRARCGINTDCSVAFTGTNRIEGRVTASQIASASAEPFLLLGVSLQVARRHQLNPMSERVQLAAQECALARASISTRHGSGDRK
jgi:hypothetical protein